MKILDAKLQYLKQKAASAGKPFHILLRFRNDISALTDLGFKVTTLAGDVAAGSVEGERLEQLLKHPDLISAEFAPGLKDETDLSLAAINLVNPATQTRAVPSLGRGAVIGIIDSGFDLTHPCFNDAQGESRILAAWDQVGLGSIKGPPPAEFGYGVEVTPPKIGPNVKAQGSIVIKNAEKKGAHGTSVACIAAGNGLPDGARAGVAPEAELILVSYRNDVPVGGSSFLLDAINFILLRAGNKPVVINISQGDNLGAHDGTSLLERAIDHLIEKRRVAIVCSAGNERRGMHHAQGLVTPGRDFSLYFDLNINENEKIDEDMIEIWYRGEDRFMVALTPPGGDRSAFIRPGEAEMITFADGTRAFVCSETDDPNNGDNQIAITLEKGEGWKAGRGEVTLRPTAVTDGGFHAWADHPSRPTLISFAHPSDTCTVTLPGNSRRIIAVSGFVSRPFPPGEEGSVVGELQPLTSLGPTRDGRVKPDLTAPGFIIMAPEIHQDGNGQAITYLPQMGTSMAAPHVTGVIALLLSLKPDLSVERIRAALFSTAASDSFTGLTPNVSWGQGRLNAGAAYQVLSIPTAKERIVMPNGNQFTTTSVSVPFKYKNGDDQLIPMILRIEVNDDEATITAESEVATYAVDMLLRKVSGAEGGDQCIRCDPKCHVVDCPPPNP